MASHRLLLLFLVWIGSTFVTEGGPWAAELDPVAFVWTAPAECPSAEAIHDQVEKGLGGSAKDLAPVAAVATVVRGVGRWQAKLTLHARGQRADREFEAESCEALAQAMALIIALAAEGPDLAGPASATGEGTDLPNVPDTAKRTSDSDWTNNGFGVQLDTVLDRGTMPASPAPGIELTAIKMWKSSVGRLRLMAGTSYFFSEDGPQPALPGRYWDMSASARGCATAVLGRFEFGPCLGGELVMMRGTHIFGTETHSTQFWLSPLASGILAFALSRQVAVFLRGDFVVPGTRRTFWGNGGSGLTWVEYTVPSSALRGAAGVEMRFF